MDYFSLFGLIADFNINIKKLALIFQDLQRQYHPDKFVNCTQDERVAAIQRSATINQAWQTLRNPLTRAEYLLSLHGLDIKNTSNTLYDKQFLVEQFKLHEELEDIIYRKNNARLRAFKQYINKIYDIQYMQMITALNQKNWDIAAKIMQKLRFLNKLRSNTKKFKEK